MQDLDEIRRRLDAAARHHLGEALGARWSSMLTEGCRLVPADDRDGGAAVVGRLGGPAPLAAGTPWPTWDGFGPLSHVATLDCARLHPHLPAALREAGFPRDGLLSFFYFDGQLDDGENLVGALFGTEDGARVLHTPAAAHVAPVDPPPTLSGYDAVELTVEPVLTWPTWEHPELVDAESDGWDDLWEVLEGLREEMPLPAHQVGGHPDAVQGPVELEIAEGRATGGGPAGREPAPVGDLLLLAQLDTDEDAGFMWGDAGILYFMIRADDLAAGAFDRTGFTWQCA